ncbi:MAG: helix-turn-helix domain-containing protein [Acidimicrobiia bacterium]|nr:helix-turn-helix domain-containing protein [Acidimicrobiia bacterium]
MSLTEIDTSNEVLTIEEAAAILRISRNAAYAAARQWRATGGKDGLPCIEIGRTLRVPREGLRRMLGVPTRSTA